MSYNPWINKEFPRNSYYNSQPQPVPPPASFTIGGGGDDPPRPVPPPSAMFGKPIASPLQEEEEYCWREQERKRAASPDRMSGISGISSRSRYEEEEYAKRSRMDMVPSPMGGMGDSARSSPTSCMMSLAEEFPVWGVTGVVDRYLNQTTAVITVMNANKKVLFHVNQVWMPNPDNNGSSLYLEGHPLSKLSYLVEVGEELKLNARRISGCSFSLQATAVWKRRDPPIDYKSEELLQNLNLTLNQHIFSETGDTLYKTNPLAGTPDYVVSAKVQEYFSFELGFLKLDSGDRGVVLFHLNQVWTGGDNAVPYKEVQDIVLPEFLPVGSSVMVNMRKLQASTGSDLKYQATLVWPRKIDDETSDKLLPEYLSHYGPYERRVSFVAELNTYHDQMKSILNMNLSSYDPDFVPVQAVLNGLPHHWQAQVVSAVDDDLGLIKISHSQGLDLAPMVPSLLALFHLEDVFDANGIPAIKSANVCMENLMDSFVDLTARPISEDLKPMKILQLQRSLNEQGVNSRSFPVLQAVVVCVKIHPNDDILFTGFPKPTPLRDNPGCFGSGMTEFYLNPLLNTKLDVKLSRFLRLSGKKSNLLPYKTKKKSNSFIDQIIRGMRKVDCNRSERFLYGEFPSDIRPLSSGVELPKVLECQVVKLKYLHRREEKNKSPRIKSDCGVVEICLSPFGSSRETITTYAFFRLNNYIFFTSKDCFASDLVNVMPIYSKERFCINAKLSFPESRIPYVVEDIWNDNLREDQNYPVPKMSDMREKELGLCRESIMEITKEKLDFQNERFKEKSLNVRNEKSKEMSSTERRQNLIEIPPNIGKSNTTKCFDINKVIMEGEELVRKLENVTGIVENILTPNIALVTIRNLNRIYRVLCSSDDVFDLKFKERIPANDFYLKNTVRFSNASEVWNLTARKNKSSLQVLLRKGHKVKLNAVPFFCHPNPADVYYVSSGVLAGRNSLDHPVPVHCIESGSLFSNAWKESFENCVRSLGRDGRFRDKRKFLIPPSKVPDFLKKGTSGKMELREEYQGVGPLPTPVRTNKFVAGPVVWKDILNDQYGQVIRIMDKNYGLAAGFAIHGGRSGQPEFEPYQILFDTFDVYLGYHDCNHLGKTLADVMKVGDYIRFNGVRVDPATVGDARDIRYLATAVITSESSEEVKKLHFPIDIAKIETIDQVAKTKVSNFKIVAGVMNTTKLNKVEQELLEDIRKGKLGKRFMDLSNISTDYVLQESEGSDDEATCGENLSNHSKKKKKCDKKDENIVDIQKLVDDLKPKVLRKLIMSYIEIVSKLPENAPKEKFDIASIIKSLNTEKNFGFFVDFFISLGYVCSSAEKGIKVGHVFLTQTQVKAIRNKGISGKDDIDMNQTVPNVGKTTEEKVTVVEKSQAIALKQSVEDKAPEDIVYVDKDNSDKQAVKADNGLHKPSTSVGSSSSSQVSSMIHENVLDSYSTTDLRKYIFTLMKVIDNTTTAKAVAEKEAVTEDKVNKVFAAITFKCKEAPIVDGKKQSFKLKNIFMNSTWTEKIAVFNFQ